MTSLSAVLFPEEKIYHADPLRYKRSVTASFAGEMIVALAAAILLLIFQANLVWPVRSLIYLIAIALGINVLGLAAIFFCGDIRRVIGIKSLAYSFLFAPTLAFTGGFVSPFVIVYLLCTILVTAMVDVIPRRIGQINVILLIGSYVVVSILQKAGVLPVYVDYAEKLLHIDSFFWTVFTVTLLCFICGYFILRTTSRNVRDTVNQMVNIHHHVARGTAGYMGGAFFTQLLSSLCEAMEVESAFLIEWYDNDRFAEKMGHLYKFSDGEIVRDDIEISDEIEKAAGMHSTDTHVFPIGELPSVFETILTYPLKTSYGYWIPVIVSNKKPVGLLLVANRKKLSVDPIVSDILSVFAGRIGSELERIQALQKELHMQRMLSQGQKMHAIGKLAGGITHDFNNFITSINGFAYLIKKRVPIDSKAYNYADKILSIAVTASNLTKQLLSFGRRNSNERSLMNIHQTIENTTTILAHTLPKKIQIIKQLESQETIIMGNQSSLQSAILNLAINARDAMEGEGILRIKTETVRLEERQIYCSASGRPIEQGVYIVLSVQDNGGGIPPELFGRLFEPFFTTRKKKGGTGLGLAQVYGYMENHHGFITVESAPGKGTAFSLYFPASNYHHGKSGLNPDAQQTNRDVKSAFITAGAQKIDLNERENLKPHLPSILLVDDSAYQLEMLMDSLENHFNLFKALDGREGLEKFRSNHEAITAVISDIEMPEMDGITLCKSVNEITDYKVPVILMSGRIKESDKEALEKCGARTFLPKPFDAQKLIRILKSLMSYTTETSSSNNETKS